jgi:hypothetical protein
VIDGGRTITTVTFGLTGAAITSATLAAPARAVSPTPMSRITDGAGTGAVLTPTWSDPDPEFGMQHLTGVTVSAGGAGYTRPSHGRALLLGVPQRQVTFTPTIVGRPSHGRHRLRAPGSPRRLFVLHDLGCRHRGLGRHLHPDHERRRRRRHRQPGLLDLLPAAPGLCRHHAAAADPVVQLRRRLRQHERQRPTKDSDAITRA